VHNVTTRVGDGWQGWREQAPFQRIIVTAAATALPDRLIDQLGPGGIMVCPVGAESRTQRLIRVSRDEAGAVGEEDLGEVRFVPLVAGLPQQRAAGGPQGG
jgi:protein-L-isoaspartate(D-aspartate) O-methyltransferase